MKTKTYLKDIFRGFKSSITKLLSILAMVGLGALIIVGLGHTGQSMRDTMRVRLEEMNAPDLTITSTFGLDYEDQALIESKKDNNELIFSYFFDVKDDNDLLRLHALEKKPNYTIIEGRLPSEDNEIALDRVYAQGRYRLGDEIEFTSLTSDSLNKSLKNNSYIITGFVNSSEYLFDDIRGTSLIGKTSIDGFGVINKDNFKLENYSLAYLFLDKDDFSSIKEYKDFVNSKKNEIDTSMKFRPEDRLEEIKTEANNEIADAEKEIESAEKDLSEAEKEIKDGERKLKDGFKEYDEGKARLEEEISKGENELYQAKLELDEAKKTLDKGQADYDAAKNKFEFEISQGQKKIDSGKAKLVESKVKLDEAKANYKRAINQLEASFQGPRAELEETKEKLNQTRASLDAGWTDYQKALDEFNEMIKPKPDPEPEPTEPGEDESLSGEILDDLDSSQSSSLYPDDSEIEKIKAELALKKSELEAKELEYKTGVELYKSAVNELEAKYESENQKLQEAKVEIDRNEIEYNNALNEIIVAEETLNTEKASGEAQLQEALNQVNSGKTSYETGLKEYEAGQEKLREAKAIGEEKLKDSYKQLIDSQTKLLEANERYESEAQEANEQISSGKNDIKKAKDGIFKLSPPSYEVQPIYKNFAVENYWTNSEKMDSLSYAFPAFFYLVAMLVTITTMKRIVDEERTQIGTLKSLGYSNKQISRKYYIYGLIPSLLGGIIGSLIGYFYITPTIFEAYSSGFAVGVEVLKPNLLLIGITIILSVALITFTVYLSVKKSLESVPANLLRPEAPKSGSRIFLENFDGIWSRLSFLQKITARNIFRYKSRMLMTILGVGGCTALIFFGYAIRDSIIQYHDLQFNELMKFDIISIYDTKAEKDSLEEYKELLDEESSTSVHFKIGTISNNDKEIDVSLVVPNDPEKFKDFVTLRHPKGENLELSNEGAIISQKTAKLENLSKGDKLVLYDEDDNVKKIEIADITENYLNHYIYMTQNYYEETFDKEAEMNADYIIARDSEDLQENLIKNDAVLSVVNIDKVGLSAQGLLDSLNLVIGIIILVSGLLAIVVLYNLTNINVSERKRELSTIKVLGFYPRELTSYIYRETFILTIMGIVLGYLIGIGLHKFIINLVAPDPIMLVPFILAKSYIMSALVTLIISTLVMFIVHNRLKRINMVEALKAVE